MEYWRFWNKVMAFSKKYNCEIRFHSNGSNVIRVYVWNGIDEEELIRWNPFNMDEYEALSEIENNLDKWAKDFKDWKERVML